MLGTRTRSPRWDLATRSRSNALLVALIITTSRVRDTHFVASGGARRRTSSTTNRGSNTSQPLVASRAAIDAHALVDNEPVSETLREALITEDSKVIYPVVDNIPVLLEEKGIGTTQFTDF